ncbi:50S ribosomal protein L25 [Buchnera aphidicola]|uniref:Large ribosomal subunit protein bL25 n=1 Tax=Buchnera aphidicola subsp. Schizaphis graminum (strain Sg) TaxID=198804 RepID=RL25_BUCAP|nr:50S ribosomal protein L25 [Buchnera aphidicola]Q8KA03.1 RecName: Full=Large ribosomal subunit protein bL25; AltName: Full=50S ribosomal protein L25 [Buchnera aphidicola str. Sg (Schizaphis graminum)]AAM67699.1 50S ribosomal protein L25 [Buchnera aphidicola str. Sg (Schizaphis graminum)]AWI49804.1 50S ribosomal protein L25 [Buchnera aphidicola (Schizaphis graminum)]
MFIVKAEIRDKKGKSFSRKLRIEDKFPGVLYGFNNTPISITMDHNLVFNLQKKEDFYKETLCLLIKEKKYTVKVHAIQRHAFKMKILHIDFIYAKI